MKISDTVCVIGARSGSKSIPNKNLLQLGNKSLIEIAILKALSTKCFKRIVLSSDSDDYLAIARNLGVDAVKRPLNISKSNSTEFEYISHALESLGVKSKDAIVARMQVTSPFQKKSTISGCIDLLRLSDVSSVQAVAETPTNAHKSMLINKRGYLEPLLTNGSISPTNRQGYPSTYVRANFWCARLGQITAKSLLGSVSLPFIVGWPESIDIDDINDWRIVQSVFEKDAGVIDI